MQNWFLFLPWAGPAVKRQAEYVQSLGREIELLKRQIAVIEQQKEHEHQELQKMVDKDWSQKEQKEKQELYQKYVLDKM